MKTWTGALEYRDLGPGGWSLESDDGSVVQLVGSIPRSLAGTRVRVQGQVVDAMGAAMVGTILVEVTRIDAV